MRRDTSFRNRRKPRPCANCVGKAPRLPIFAVSSVCPTISVILLGVVENASVTSAAIACHAGCGKGRGTMAAKRRSRRITQPVKKRRAKKRASSAAANVRGARKSAVTGSGMVEAALAAFAHEVRTPLTGILAISNLLATSELDERERGSVALQVTPLRSPKGKVAVAFEVSDSGIGLTLSEIKRLFRPFSQANVSIASRFGGAGLGLSSVKQLARAMGGDVTVTQRRGGGATFTFNVVMSSAKDAVTAASGADGEVSIGSPRPLRLLSVEDNPFGRVVLNAILTELGHQAEFIGQGEAAPERLAHGAFDAVLMEMILPGISGVEAIRRIRALEAPLGRIPIIGISGRGEDEAASRAAGADIFLVKPVSPRALAIALHEATSPSSNATS